MTAVLIEPADLNRVAAELNAAHGTGPEGPYAWAEAEGISPEALAAMFKSGHRMLDKNICAGVPVEDVLDGLMSGAFHLGWEAHKEYGGGRA